MRGLLKFAVCTLILILVLQDAQARGRSGSSRSSSRSSSSSSSRSSRGRSSRGGSSSSGSFGSFFKWLFGGSSSSSSSHSSSPSSHTSSQSRTSYNHWESPPVHGPPPAYSASNPIGGARTNIHEPPPAYSPELDATRAYNYRSRGNTHAWSSSSNGATNSNASPTASQTTTTERAFEYIAPTREYKKPVPCKPIDWFSPDWKSITDEDVRGAAACLYG